MGGRGVSGQSFFFEAFSQWSLGATITTKTGTDLFGLSEHRTDRIPAYQLRGPLLAVCRVAPSRKDARPRSERRNPVTVSHTLWAAVQSHDNFTVSHTLLAAVHRKTS